MEKKKIQSSEPSHVIGGTETVTKEALHAVYVELSERLRKLEEKEEEKQ